MVDELMEKFKYMNVDITPTIITVDVSCKDYNNEYMIMSTVSTYLSIYIYLYLSIYLSIFLSTRLYFPFVNRPLYHSGLPILH